MVHYEYINRSNDILSMNKGKRITEGFPLAIFTSDQKLLTQPSTGVSSTYIKKIVVGNSSQENLRQIIRYSARFLSAFMTRNLHGTSNLRNLFYMQLSSLIYRFICLCVTCIRCINLIVCILNIV